MRSFRILNGFVFALVLVFGLTPFVQGQVATTTQLVIPVPTVAVGVPTLLTATVTDVASHPVLVGTVTFYDGSHSLGSAQIVSGTSGAYPLGTANLKTASFSAGANSITAVFSGTKSDLKSTSSAKTVTVTGQYETTTTLNGYVTGTDFFLTAEVRNFGPGTPTGDVDFVHISNGATIGSKSLSGATWTPDLSIGSTTDLLGEPYKLVAGDFNGDGIPDVATINLSVSSERANFSVLLGKGAGKFQPQTSYIYQGRNDADPLTINTGDFNNDGRLDLVIFDASGYSFSVYLGNGDGTFQARRAFRYADIATSAYVGDFNGDGKLDIAVSGQTNGAVTISVLLGDGSGSFQTQAAYPIADAYSALAGGDLNGDGALDLVRASSDGVNVLLGKGDGTFSAPTDYPLLAEANIAALADVNGDGKLDVILLSLQPGGTVCVALGRGDGSFETPQNYALGGQAPTGYPEPLIAVADFDQDGKLDLIINVSANPQALDAGLNLLRGNGDGTFQPAVVYLPELPYGTTLITADLNGDGRPDLAELNYAEYTVTTILNGQSTSLHLAKEGLGPGRTTVEADYSGDADFAASVSNRVPLFQTDIDFSGGFAGGAPGLDLNSGAAVAGGVLQLSNGSLNQATSVFTASPVSIQAFSSDFTFQILDPGADGFTFAIQNAGPNSVGSIGGGLGYRGMQKSLAIKFDIYNNSGEGTNSTGLFTNGANPTLPDIDLSEGDTGINLRSGDAFKAHITYDGKYLTLTLTDTVTLATWSQPWAIDIPATVGGPTAYVGFTGGTGGKTSTETIGAWRFLSQTPPPNFPAKYGFIDTVGLLFNGSASVNVENDQVVLTTGGEDQAGSIYYAAPQNVQAFTTDFMFDILGDPRADGLTFTIQNAGPTAVGGIGGELGYKSIPESVAIKFDMYNNDGEGKNSTGLYIDGASPDIPAIDMTSSGLNLHSATNGGGGNFDPFEVHITYDGTNLTMKIVDFYTLATFSHSWAIDIPATVGGTTAYVGFTGATGGLPSVDQLNNWTYVPGMP